MSVGSTPTDVTRVRWDVRETTHRVGVMMGTLQHVGPGTEHELEKGTGEMALARRVEVDVMTKRLRRMILLAVAYGEIFGHAKPRGTRE